MFDVFKRSKPATVLTEDQKSEARQTTIDQVEAAKRQIASALTDEAQTLEPLRAAVLKSQARWRSDEAKLLTAQKANGNRLHQLRHHVERLEGDLRATADPRIDDVKRELDARWEKTRHVVGRSWDVRTGEIDPMTRKPIVIHKTNEKAIQRVCAALREARHGLDALKVANPSDLDRAIAEVLAPVEAAWNALDVPVAA